MAAFSASRYYPVLKPFFLRLKAQGKPYRICLTAVMHKLLIHANAALKQLAPPAQ
jgi:transposase